MAAEQRSADFWAGAREEARLRDEPFSEAALDVRSTLEAFAQLRPRADEVELTATLFHIYAAGLPLWRRILLALRGP